MRRFSLTEQKIIRKLVVDARQSFDYVLANVYNDIFYQRRVKYSNGELVFYLEDINTLSDVGDILSIEKEIIDISILIDYLIKNRYIIIIEDPSSADPLKEIGGFLTEGLTPVGKKIDTNVAKILDDAMNHRAFISEDLVQLVQNNFKTIEDMALDEARKQTNYSRKSVIFAIIAVILSVIIPILSALLSSNVVKLDSGQYEQLYNCCADYEKNVDMAHQRQTDTVMEVIYIDTCIKH
ncbi:MAG: hypothetical protein J6X62_07840 [Bacteroidales bacterium]|nr:hypothetical protein [Bacteroidales bacterium]